MKTPLAWKNITHNKLRTVTSLAGVGFAILLIFMQLGFYDACFRSSTMVFDQLDFDVALVSPQYVHLRASGSNRNLFSQGAGQVNGTSAIDPGLVYKSGGFLKYFGFLCGTGQLVSPSCASLKIDPSDLNLPSIAIGDLAGTQTITRRVTNVGSSAATYNVSKSGLAGLDVVITPSSLTLNQGASKSYTVQFTNQA